MENEHTGLGSARRSNAWMGFHTKPASSASSGKRWVGYEFLSTHGPAVRSSYNIRRVGAVLYTSYLQLLGIIHPPSSLSTKRIYPPPPIQATFVAGFTAGTIQSVLAAPLDAIQNRVCINEVLEGQHKNMWLYGKNKLWNIGLQGVFAGWGISFLKESLGFGVFFASFEFVKQQLYYTSLTQYYGNANLYAMNGPSKTPGCKDAQITIKPHYALEPMFILLAGVTASVAQQVIQHPLALLQNLHYQRLESPFTGSRSSDTGRSTSVNSQTYQETFREARSQALRVGGWRNWLFKGLMRNTLRQIPSTSAGLIIFELVKRGYATSEDEQVIEMDGVRISLS